MSPLMPARCHHCGWTGQPPGGIYLGAARNVTFGSVSITCPACGNMAEGVNGTFDSTPDSITVVDGPEWTKDLIDKLGLAVRRLLDEDPPDPLAELKAEVPEVGTPAEEAVVAGLAARGKPNNLRRRRQLGKKVLGGLVGLIAFPYNDAVDNVTWVAEQVQDLFDYVAEHGDVPPTR